MADTAPFRRAIRHYPLPMRRRFIALALAAVAAASLTACGGPMSPDELKRSIETLESTAAEGQLLAGDVAGDRTKATFVRVPSRDLGDVVVHEAEKLNDAEAEAEGGVAPTKARAIELADRISAALGRIQIAPDSETEGRTAEETLSRLSEQAAQLAEGL